jgi:hypothetical protein
VAAHAIFFPFCHNTIHWTSLIVAWQVLLQVTGAFSASMLGLSKNLPDLLLLSTTARQ